MFKKIVTAVMCILAIQVYASDDISQKPNETHKSAIRFVGFGAAAIAFNKAAFAWGTTTYLGGAIIVPAAPAVILAVPCAILAGSLYYASKSLSSSGSLPRLNLNPYSYFAKKQ